MRPATCMGCRFLSKMSLAIVTGILSCFGGLIGFLKSNSIPSLIAGNLFGLLYIIGGYMTTHGKRPNGRILILVVSTLLLIAMGKKAFGGKLVPVIMTLLAVGNLIAYYPE